MSNFDNNGNRINPLSPYGYNAPNSYQQPAQSPTTENQLGYNAPNSYQQPLQAPLQQPGQLSGGYPIQPGQVQPASPVQIVPANGCCIPVCPAYPKQPAIGDRSPPSNLFSRYTYRTSRTSEQASPSSGAGSTQPQSVVIPEANAWEAFSQVSSDPGWLLGFEASINPDSALASTPTPGSLGYYVLAFDLVPSTVAWLAFAGLSGLLYRPNPGATALYSFGPLVPGGNVVYRSEELISLRDQPTFCGDPIDGGLLLLLSTTPVIYTPPLTDPAPVEGGDFLATMNVTARWQART